MLPGAHSPLQLSANWHVLPSGGLQLSIGERHLSYSVAQAVTGSILSSARQRPLAALLSFTQPKLVAAWQVQQRARREAAH